MRRVSPGDLRTSRGYGGSRPLVPHACASAVAVLMQACGVWHHAGEKPRVSPSTPQQPQAFQMPSPPTPVPDSPLSVPGEFCEKSMVPPRTEAIDDHGQLAAFLGKLPRPLSLPCFLAALPRPIAIQATTSTQSLQPAQGPANPRLFLRLGHLVVSVATVGDFAMNLETSEEVAPGETVKGDLTFPLRNAVAEKDFFDHIVPGTDTSCGFCHQSERPARTVDGFPVPASQALKPRADQIVPLSELKALAEKCEASANSHRCQLLRALFWVPEKVTTFEFPASHATVNAE